MERLAILVVMMPLLAGIVNGLFCHKLNHKQAGAIASTAMFISALSAGVLFYCTGLNGQLIHIVLGKWLQLYHISVSWGIYVDQLTSIMFVVVTFVSIVVHIYSLGYMHKDEGLPKFLSFLSLFTFFMLMLVSADNFLQLLFGWEGVGLCSYLLIGFWHSKDSANAAAIKAFIVNRVGDFAFIFGVIIIAIYAGSLDFATVFAKALELSNTKLYIAGVEVAIIDIICLLLFIGATGKSAQIGLHVWLPDAMEGPTPVSALIHAATMVTAGVFLVARCSYLFEYSPVILQVIAITGGITCIFAASIAVTQTDIKKIIAYSTCSQLGYMFLACGVSAYQAAIFHLATHAFFKALLFLSAGSVIHACHEQDILKMGGLKAKMPWTYTNFWAGSLAIVGIYPLAGFYSKDLILESSYAAGGVGEVVFALGIVAALLTAIYSMKIIMLVFHGSTRLSEQAFNDAHEAPIIMNAPLVLLTAGTMLSGMLGHYMLSIGKPTGYFMESIFNLHLLPDIHEIPRLIKFLPMIIGGVGIAIGIYNYRKAYQEKPSSWALKKLVQNKYYFDELYQFLIIKPLYWFSCVANIIDQKVIDRFGPTSFANLASCTSRLTVRLQTGYIFNYALMSALAILICVTFFVIKWQLHVYQFPY